MSRIRRPLIAISALLALILIQLILDPTGLLALVGWPGGTVQPGLWWPLAPYVVFVPVLGAATWWAAVRVGGRFWVMSLAVIWAVTLAQAAALLAMTGDLPLAAWGSGYVLAKAIPAALIVAGLTRVLGGRAAEREAPGDAQALSEVRLGTAGVPAAALWPGILLTALVALIPTSYWWAAPVNSPLLPAPQPDRAWFLLLAGILLWIACAWWAVRLLRSRIGGMLGAWLGFVLAGAVLGLLLSIISLPLDGIGADLWPLMSAYARVADGISFGATAGGLGVAAIAIVELLLAAPMTTQTQTPPRTGTGVVRRARILGAGLSAALVIAMLAMVLVAPEPDPDRAPAEAVDEGFLRVDGDRIVDGADNQVLLRGVNVNQLVDFYQYDPALPATTPFTEEDVARIAAYGFNVIRLNLSWSALEPERGSYDAGYLQRVDQAVDWAGRAGVRVVLDMHQDGWWNGPSPADVQCRPGTDPMWGYDGAPGWATITDGAPRCQFQGRDISPAGDRAFEHFFFDTAGIRRALAETWGMLAARYGDNPLVAGFDLLNEPGFGETAPATTALKLGDFYVDAIREIRDAGSPQIVFVEPSILWSGLGFDTGPRPSFTADTNIAFSPHLYAESITMDRDLGIPPIVGMERQFDLAQRVADSYGAAVWSGEYGYWGDDLLPRLRRYAATEDAHAFGSAYWVWKQACGDPQNGKQATGDGLIPQDCATGEELPPKEQILRILSRPYPHVAVGRIERLSSSPDRIDLTGRASGDSCGLQLWFPGSEYPRVDTDGVERLGVSRVNGGWIIDGCASGEYRISASR